MPAMPLPMMPMRKAFPSEVREFSTKLAWRNGRSAG